MARKLLFENPGLIDLDIPGRISEELRLENELILISKTLVSLRARFINFNPVPSLVKKKRTCDNVFEKKKTQLK